MIVQEPYFSMYPPSKIMTPESIDDPMSDSPYQERSTRGDQVHYRNADQIRQMRSIYYGMVREIDDWIGVILDQLDELGIANKTLVVFTSDHGEMLGDHGLHSKMIFYEGSVHIPLLMRFPGRIRPGTVVQAPVAGMDVAPTILDYLGMPIPKSNGISLRPFIEGKPVDHDVVAYSSGQMNPNYMIRHGDLKLMMGQDETNKSLDGLYDLKNDPLEMRNLIVSPVSPKKNRVQAMMMKTRLIKWLEKHEPHRVPGLQKRDLF
jgi:arylsulfatase A-like enzyme